METSDESGDEDDTLNREQTDLKLANIAAKRSQPVSLEDQAKTRRREIIMREMSESLRRSGSNAWHVADAQMLFLSAPNRPRHSNDHHSRRSDERSRVMY